MDLSYVEALRREFPDKNIVLLPEDDPEEVVVELGGDENESVAIALIERSKKHFHRRMTETYVVEHGTLIVYVDTETWVLQAGDSLSIEPNSTHWAEMAGDVPARVRVTASPPWSPDDHILCDPE